MAIDPDQIILQIVDEISARLFGITDRESSQKPGPDRWCKKEILGHLIDSAGNNHQRFVHAQEVDELVAPGYTQDTWVRVQDYAHEDWPALIDLWASLNSHLAHIIGRIPKDKLSTPCRIGERAAITLEALIKDYVRHMEHHLQQVDPAYKNILQ